MQHNMAHIPPEFWQPNLAMHPSPFHPSLLHQNIMPNYKIPHIQAILSQYMGNLGLFSYPHNLSAAGPSAAGSGLRVSPTISPKGSPPLQEMEK